MFLRWIGIAHLAINNEHVAKCYSLRYGFDGTFPPLLVYETCGNDACCPDVHQPAVAIPKPGLHICHDPLWYHM